MAHADLNRELSDEDRDQLATMLSRVVGGKISNLETLDGFLTALVICPEPIRPSEFVPLILSGKTEDGDLVFASAQEAEQFYKLLLRYWNEINRTFRDADIYMPYLFEDRMALLTGTIGRRVFWKAHTCIMTPGRR